MPMLRRSDLKIRLMLYTVLLSAGCFTAAAAYVLVEAGQRARARAAWIAEVAANDLELQRQKATWIASLPPASPDLRNIAPLLVAPGVCIAHRDTAGMVRQRFCGGAEPAEAPALFAVAYRLASDPEREVARGVFFRGQKSGDIVVQLDPPSLIAQAWRETNRVLGVLAVTLLALCGLLYAALARVLRPTRLIRAGLQRLAANDLAARLPPFDLGELSAISGVFNRLAESLAAALAERDALLRRLLTVQDDERRRLARDLHDEFGQCLAATGALVASVRQTAAQDCPSLVPECDSAGRIVARMMRTLRDVLLRLRPPDLDELGLAASLRNLVAEWNGGSQNGTRFRIELSGDLDQLPSPLGTALYRVAQEAITNAAKHARARLVVLRLAARRPSPGDAAGDVALSVEDDGITDDRDSAGKPGMGLLGMQERISALGGTLTLRPRQPAGLVLSAAIPWPDAADSTPVLASAA